MPQALSDVHVKIDTNIKKDTEEVLSKIGISLSDLIRMTCIRTVREQDIPFRTSLKELPENMRITSEEELIAHLKKNLEEEEKDPTYYTIEEVEEHLKNL